MACAFLNGSCSGAVGVFSTYPSPLLTRLALSRDGMMTLLNSWFVECRYPYSSRDHDYIKKIVNADFHPPEDVQVLVVSTSRVA